MLQKSIRSPMLGWLAPEDLVEQARAGIAQVLLLQLDECQCAPEWLVWVRSRANRSASCSW